jgi:hypothetical protein
VILIALALLAAQPVADEPAEDSLYTERQPVRLAPLPVARAPGAFRDICMAGFPDAAAFDRAAAASDLGFVRSERAERDSPEWSSRHGRIVLHGAEQRSREARRERRRGEPGGGARRGPRLRWLARCDFWMAIEERLDEAAVVRAIGAQLAPDVRPREEILGVSWLLESPRQDAVLKLVFLPSTDDDPRLFTLSLQLLPIGPWR